MFTRLIMKHIETPTRTNPSITRICNSIPNQFTQSITSLQRDTHARTLFSVNSTFASLKNTLFMSSALFSGNVVLNKTLSSSLMNSMFACGNFPFFMVKAHPPGIISGTSRHQLEPPIFLKSVVSLPQFKESGPRTHRAHCCKRETLVTALHKLYMYTWEALFKLPQFIKCFSHMTKYQKQSAIRCDYSIFLIPL